MLPGPTGRERTRNLKLIGEEKAVTGSGSLLVLADTTLVMLTNSRRLLMAVAAMANIRLGVVRRLRREFQ